MYHSTLREAASSFLGEGTSLYPPLPADATDDQERDHRKMVKNTRKCGYAIVLLSPEALVGDRAPFKDLFLSTLYLKHLFNLVIDEAHLEDVAEW